MQIDFDSKNSVELAAVAALIAVLRGEDATVGVVHVTSDNIDFFTHGGEEASESAADAAEAFAGAEGVNAEQAFGGGAPLAPAAPGTSPTSAPVGEAATGAAPAGGQAAPPIASPSSGVDVDKSGLPHDARIHSSPPKKNADGSWRQKRGVDTATVEAVSAELRRALAAPAATVATGAPPAPDMPSAIAQAQAHLAGPTPAAPPPPPPVAAAAPPPPPPAAADTGAPINAPAPTAPAAAAAGGASSAPAVTFADVMRKITGLQTAGKLTVEGTQQIAQSLELSGVRDLIHRPDLVPIFDQLLPAA